MPFYFKVKTDLIPEDNYIRNISSLERVYYSIADKIYKKLYSYDQAEDLELVEGEIMSFFADKNEKNPIITGRLEQKDYDLLQANIKFLESKNNNPQFLKQKDLFVSINEYIHVSSKNPSHLTLSLTVKKENNWSSRDQENIFIFYDGIDLTKLLDSNFQEKFNENYEKFQRLVYDMKYEAQRLNQLFS